MVDRIATIILAACTGADRACNVLLRFAIPSAVRMISPSMPEHIEEGSLRLSTWNLPGWPSGPNSISRIERTVLPCSASTPMRIVAASNHAPLARSTAGPPIAATPPTPSTCSSLNVAAVGTKRAAEAGGSNLAAARIDTATCDHVSSLPSESSSSVSSCLSSSCINSTSKPTSATLRSSTAAVADLQSATAQHKAM